LCRAADQEETTKEFSDVTIGESIAEDDSIFVNNLLDLLVKKSILDEPTSSRILVTFKIKGVNRNTDGAEAFTKESISDASVKGDADAQKKFVARISGLLDNTEKREKNVIGYLLELVLDNQLIEGNAAAQFAADAGYSIDIKITTVQTGSEDGDVDVAVRPKLQSKPQIKKKHKEQRPQKKCSRTMTFQNPSNDDDLPKFINFLIEILVNTNVFDESTAGDILTTFDVEPTGNQPAGTMLSLTTINTVKIRAHRIARKKFFTFVVSHLTTPKPLTDLVVSLLQLLIDNGNINPDDATKLAKTHNIIITITTNHIPQREPKPRPDGNKPRKPKGPRQPRGPDSDSGSSSSESRD